MDAEHRRLEETRSKTAPWRKWGTVREHCSDSGFRNPEDFGKQQLDLMLKEHYLHQVAEEIATRLNQRLPARRPWPAAGGRGAQISGGPTLARLPSLLRVLPR